MNAPQQNVFLRNLLQLCISFVMGGVSYVIPQIFFLRQAPTQKQFWLSVFLFSGTVAAVLGISASQRWSVRRTQKALLTTQGSLGSLCLLMGALALMFWWPWLWLFLALNLVLRFQSNFHYNLGDIGAVRTAPPTQRAANDQVITLYRLIGLILGPLYFGLCYDRLGWTTALVIVLIVVCQYSSSQVMMAPPFDSAREPEPEANMTARPVDPDALETADAVASSKLPVGLHQQRAERAVLLYAFLVNVVLFLIASNIIYILRDFIKLPKAQLVGSLLLPVVFVVATIGAALTPGIQKRVRLRLGLSAEREDATSVPLLALTIPTLVIAAMLMMFLGRWLSSPVTVFVSGGSIGLAYGIFQIELRDYITRRVRYAGRDVLLSLSNNLPNIAGLTAYALMLSLAGLRQRVVFGMYAALLWIMLGLTILGLPLLLWAWSSARQSR